MVQVVTKSIAFCLVLLISLHSPPTVAQKLEPLDCSSLLTIDEYIEQATSFVGEKAYFLALTSINCAIEVDATRGDLYVMRGFLWLRVGFLDEAEADLTYALEIDPEQEEGNLLLSNVYFYRGDYHLALSLVNQLISDKPDSAYYHRLRGQIWKKLQNETKSLASFQQAVTVGGPHDGQSYAELGFAYQYFGYQALADENLALALDAQPTVVYQYLMLSEEAIVRRDSDDALENLDKAQQLSPTLWYIYSLRASIYGERGEYEKAKLECENIIDVEPNNPEGFVCRGLIALYTDELREALSNFEQALALDEENIPAHRGRALALAKLKQDLDSALQDINKAIDAEPFNPAAYQTRSIIFIEMGKRNEAIEDLEMVLKLTGGAAANPDILNLIDGLEQLTLEGGGSA